MRNGAMTFVTAPSPGANQPALLDGEPAEKFVGLALLDDEDARTHGARSRAIDGSRTLAVAAGVGCHCHAGVEIRGTVAVDGAEENLIARGRSRAVQAHIEDALFAENRAARVQRIGAAPTAGGIAEGGRQAGNQSRS